MIGVGRGQELILADVDKLVGELVRAKLASHGHVVGVVTNDADALKAIWAKRPQLVILDCNMPEVSGIGLLRELKKAPELYEIPVLMLTGRGDRRTKISRCTKAPTII